MPARPSGALLGAVLLLVRPARLRDGLPPLLPGGADARSRGSMRKLTTRSLELYYPAAHRAGALRIGGPAGGLRRAAARARAEHARAPAGARVPDQRGLQQRLRPAGRREHAAADGAARARHAGAVPPLRPGRRPGRRHRLPRVRALRADAAGRAACGTRSTSLTGGLSSPTSSPSPGSSRGSPPTTRGASSGTRPPGTAPSGTAGSRTTCRAWAGRSRPATWRWSSGARPSGQRLPHRPALRGLPGAHPTARRSSGKLVDVQARLPSSRPSASRCASSSVYVQQRRRALRRLRGLPAPGWCGASGPSGSSPWPRTWLAGAARRAAPRTARSPCCRFLARASPAPPRRASRMARYASAAAWCSVPAGPHLGRQQRQRCERPLVGTADGAALLPGDGGRLARGKRPLPASAHGRAQRRVTPTWEDAAGLAAASARTARPSLRAGAGLARTRAELSSPPGARAQLTRLPRQLARPSGPSRRNGPAHHDTTSTGAGSTSRLLRPEAGSAAPAPP